MEERIMKLPQSLYDELCQTLTDFENSTDNENDPEWMPDGEWLDVFYNLMVKIQNGILQ